MVSLHGLVFREIERFWKNLRNFAFENKTVFEVFFIGLYSVEQFLLILFSYKAKSVQELSFIISVFAIIVLTTFAFHKLLMESRIKYLENKVAEADSDKRILEEENRTIKISHNNVLSEMELLFSKDLNSKRFYDKIEKRHKT